jgi:hypothetical protein
VDLVGIEPTTSSMPWKRAPSCATGPHGRDTTLLFSPSCSDSSIALLGHSGCARGPETQSRLRTRLLAGAPFMLSDASVRAFPKFGAERFVDGVNRSAERSSRVAGNATKENGGKSNALAADLSLGCLQLTLPLRPPQEPYCNSLVTSCCTLLACASAAIPVWLRISYFDMFVVAAA